MSEETIKEILEAAEKDRKKGLAKGVVEDATKDPIEVTVAYTVTGCPTCPHFDKKNSRCEKTGSYVSRMGIPKQWWWDQGSHKHLRLKDCPKKG